MNFSAILKKVTDFVVREQNNLIPAIGVGVACFVLKKFGGKLKLGSDIKLSVDSSGIKITPGVSVSGGHDFDIYRSRLNRMANDVNSFKLNVSKSPANALESAIDAVYENGLKAAFDSQREKAANKIVELVKQKDNISERTKCAAIDALKKLSNGMIFDSGRQKMIDLISEIS